MDSVIRHSAILEPLRSLLGQHIVFVTNRHNCAILHPSMGTEIPRLHRDILQWSRPLVTVLVYLQDSSEESGCTQIVPGSHLIPFVESTQTGGTWMDEHEQYSDLLEQALPIPMPSGGVLALDATAFHSAGRNRSSDSRMCVALAYRSVDELDAHSRQQRAVLVSGEFVYRGNDLGGTFAVREDIGSASKEAATVPRETTWQA
jgi:ectoine hydroxylase-related dioxygenase (phytanoyl-CoA dioxygenase family)